MKINYDTPLATKIRKQIVQALNDYSMLEKNDRLMVCVSGGKDSSILLALLKEIQKKCPFDFTFEAVILDQKQPGFQILYFKKWIDELSIPLTIIQQDTYSIVKEKITDRVYCSLCSRLRRGILYNHAEKEGYTKIALGHHRDDLIETFLLNIFFTGKSASMPPKLLSDDGRNIVVRPLVYVAEQDIDQLAHEWSIPIIPCNLCGSQEGMRRKQIKKLIKNLEEDIPEIRYSMLSALGNIHCSQMLDKKLWNFNRTDAHLKSEKSVHLVNSIE